MDNSVGATGYNVYRSDDSGQHFTLLTTIDDPSVTTYDDTVTEGTAHVYRITPIDASGEGAAADASITTIPATPTLASATPVSNTEVDLTWTNNSAHATGFTVDAHRFRGQYLDDAHHVAGGHRHHLCRHHRASAERNISTR